MKRFHFTLSATNSSIVYQLHSVTRNRRRFAACFIVFIILMISPGCYLHFYRTNSQSSINAEKVKYLQERNKYFIVHFDNGIMGLEDISLQGDTIQGRLVELTGTHLKYIYPNTADKTVFKKEDRDSVLMEVHLYTNAKLNTTQTLLFTSVHSFNRADIYEYNWRATRRNKVFSTIGISVTGAVVVAALAATALWIMCNCPQVYVSRNGEYQFASGMYSGAIYSNLERMDYLPITGLPKGTKEVEFKIANSKNEEQFINKVQLMQVNHLAGTNVLPDRHGNIFAYSSPNPALSATTDGKNDIRAALTKTDDQYYSFDNRANEHGFSDLLLTFNKPANTDRARLIIHARNTYWAGLVYKEFIHLFGDKFEKWKAKQEKLDGSRLQKWQTDQALPLMVYLKTPNGWKLVDYFPLIGNTASRDMILDINTAGIKDDKIELKLETIYKFWDLDFAAMDFAGGGSLTTTAIEPNQVLAPVNTDAKAILANNDKKYVHLTGDESVYFRYTVPMASDNQVSSYFIASGGYYHNLQKISGKTSYSQLLKIKRVAGFDKFSRRIHGDVQRLADGQ